MRWVFALLVPGTLAVQVIGTGLPRSGVGSLCLALERLLPRVAGGSRPLNGTETLCFDLHELARRAARGDRAYLAAWEEFAERCAENDRPATGQCLAAAPRPAGT